MQQQQEGDVVGNDAEDPEERPATQEHTLSNVSPFEQEGPPRQERLGGTLRRMLTGLAASMRSSGVPRGGGDAVGGGDGHGGAVAGGEGAHGQEEHRQKGTRMYMCIMHGVVHHT